VFYSCLSFSDHEKSDFFVACAIFKAFLEHLKRNKSKGCTFNKGDFRTIGAVHRWEFRCV